MCLFLPFRHADHPGTFVRDRLPPPCQTYEDYFSSVQQAIPFLRDHASEKHWQEQMRQAGLSLSSLLQALMLPLVYVFRRLAHLARTLALLDYSFHLRFVGLFLLQTQILSFSWVNFFLAALMSGLDDSDPTFRVFYYDVEEMLERLRLLLDLPPAILSSGRVRLPSRFPSLFSLCLSLSLALRPSTSLFSCLASLSHLLPLTGCPLQLRDGTLGRSSTRSSATPSPSIFISPVASAPASTFSFDPSVSLAPDPSPVRTPSHSVTTRSISPVRMPSLDSTRTSTPPPRSTSPQALLRAPSPQHMMRSSSPQLLAIGSTSPRGSPSIR